MREWGGRMLGKNDERRGKETRRGGGKEGRKSERSAENTAKLVSAGKFSSALRTNVKE